MYCPSSLLAVDPPGKIVFYGPYTKQLPNSFRIINRTKHVVLFKVKTTCPKLYCMRPNVGKLRPFESVVTQMLLQPFDYQKYSRNHKFLIQSLIAPPHCDNPAEVWANTGKYKIYETKLYCILLPFSEDISCDISEIDEDKSDSRNINGAQDSSSISPSPSASASAGPSPDFGSVDTPIVVVEENKADGNFSVSATKTVTKELKQTRARLENVEVLAPLELKAEIEEFPQPARKVEIIVGKKANHLERSMIFGFFLLGTVIAASLGVIYGKFML